MPNINLRLTDEEHEQLRVWAFDGRRSLQKEIIFRLFSNGEGATVTGERHTASGRADVTAAPPGDPAEPIGEAQPSEDISISRPHDDELRPPRSGKCGMQVPAGTKCKVCGKVHPL